VRSLLKSRHRRVAGMLHHIGRDIPQPGLQNSAEYPVPVLGGACPIARWIEILQKAFHVKVLSSSAVCVNDAQSM